MPIAGHERSTAKASAALVIAPDVDMGVVSVVDTFDIIVVDVPFDIVDVVVDAFVDVAIVVVEFAVGARAAPRTAATCVPPVLERESRAVRVRARPIYRRLSAPASAARGRAARDDARSDSRGCLSRACAASANGSCASARARACARLRLRLLGIAEIAACR